MVFCRTHIIDCVFGDETQHTGLVGPGVIHFLDCMGVCKLGDNGIQSANNDEILDKMRLMDSHRLGLRIVLATYSGICTIILFVSWLTTFDWAWSLWGSLQGRIASLNIAGEGHCWLCGMSHAFRSIWQGHLEEALHYSQASLSLFTAILFGGAYFFHIVLIFVFRRPGSFLNFRITPDKFHT